MGAAALAASLSIALWAAPAVGQREGSTGSTAIAQDTVQAPPMPDAPHQFQLAVRVAWLRWGDEQGRGAVDDAPLFGMSLERIILPYLAVRASGFYGETSIVGAERATDVHQWAADLALLGRLPIQPVAGTAATPYAGLLGGAVVHDPVDPELITRSQTALGFGAGVEIDIAERIGIHLDWRHLFVQLEDIFDPQNRDGAEIESDRLAAGAFYRF